MEDTRENDAITITTLLSYSVILLSFLMKLPQIWKTYNTKLIHGVSIRGTWLELASGLLGVAYAYNNEKFHIRTYLDNVVATVQGAILVLLFIYYAQQMNMENLLYALLTILFTVSFLVRIIPISILYILMICGIPVSAGSKLFHIHELYISKVSTGVSISRWIMASYKCWARVWTILVETNELMVVLKYFICAILNCVIVFQCYYYRKNVIDSSRKRA